MPHGTRTRPWRTYTTDYDLILSAYINDCLLASHIEFTLQFPFHLLYILLFRCWLLANTGGSGFEPEQAEPKSAVLPLHHPPKKGMPAIHWSSGYDPWPTCRPRRKLFTLSETCMTGQIADAKFVLRGDRWPLKNGTVITSRLALPLNTPPPAKPVAI